MSSIFAIGLRHCRREAGLSQAGLGRKARVSGSMIGHIETGRKPATYDLAACLARALGLEGPEDFTRVGCDVVSAQNQPARPSSLALVSAYRPGGSTRRLQKFTGEEVANDV